MKVATVAGDNGANLIAAAAMALACGATFLFFSARSLIPDIAWLIEASRRWLDGAVLYRDIIEVNPPLIFYEIVALTGGHPASTAYVAGVCVIICVSALWVLRLRGAYDGLAALAAILVGGLTDFGQRDHLALIFVVPLLMQRNAPRLERVGLGLWAFLGVGLKPYLLPIPLAAGACKAVSERSLRPLFAAEYITLGLAAAAYLVAVALLHPLYFTYIIPLAQLVYGVYGQTLSPLYFVISAVVLLVCVSRPRCPLAWATLAGLASFYIQGRHWSYHLVPAIGLALLLALTEARKSRLAAILSASLITVQLLRGPPPNSQSPIPSNARSVAVLCAHVWCAYPTVLERGIPNTTRYPALWTLPGAWNIATDPREPKPRRRKAQVVLQQQRAIIRGDILRERPQYILADARPHKWYYDRPFDYIAFLGPFPGYRRVGHAGIFDIWETSEQPIRFASRDR